MKTLAKLKRLVAKTDTIVVVKEPVTLEELESWAEEYPELRIRDIGKPKKKLVSAKCIVTARGNVVIHLDGYNELIDLLSGDKNVEIIYIEHEEEIDEVAYGNLAHQ